MLLDRWQLKVEPNEAAKGEDTSNAKPELPLNVVNNYFSFGVDAHIALEFHEARGKFFLLFILIIIVNKIHYIITFSYDMNR